MKASELRIGNLYKSVKFGCPIMCELSDLYELYHRADGAYNDPPIDEIFEPITLDKIWLKKFGFIKDGKHYCKGVHCTHFSGLMKLKFDRLLQMWQFDIGSYEDLTRIVYVHQLQNLYYALTGEEL